jgi:anthranilate synthase/aminodeoxychorismate synthase-like glutamine amidotransferase
MRLLLLDNYDSFTYNLYDYLRRAGCDVAVKRNDETNVDEIESLQPNAIVLSPGPRTPNEAGCLMQVIQKFHYKLPMLGVCLGHQAIGEHFGATLRKAIKPMHGKTAKVHHNADHPLLYNVPQPFDAMRYHSLIIDNLPETLIAMGQTDDGELMMMRHATLPLFGVQFHPESILTSVGLQLIENWVSWVNGSKKQASRSKT